MDATIPLTRPLVILLSLVNACRNIHLEFTICALALTCYYQCAIPVLCLHFDCISSLFLRKYKLRDLCHCQVGMGRDDVSVDVG
jgi:hypothetical protein